MSNSESRRRAAALRHHEIARKAMHWDPAWPRPRFVADVMLGRLAKWMRIAGFDVLYSNRYKDEELVTLSQDERRILLSRDTRLLVRKSVRQFIFLESDKIQEQIRQIFRVTCTTALDSLLTRCLSCNQILSEVPRDEARLRVPLYVFQTQTRFRSCPSCRRIYWAGTHRQSVLRILESLLENRAQDKSC